jgi:predicted O-methyltransferase YrrM
MSPRSFLLDDLTAAYVVAHSQPADPVLAHLTERTAALGPIAGMQIGPDQGALLSMLTRFGGVTHAVEVGTFTGTSALCVARGLAAGGRLLCCDVSEEYTAIARRYWAEAGLSERIELHVRPAVETIDMLVNDGQAGTYDFAFIDADKLGYDAYYEGCLVLLRPGGVVAIDNVLWGGSVADASTTDASTRALRALNEKVGKDPRVSACMVPIGDGVTLARKR